MRRDSLTKFALLSIAAAVATIGLKAVAWRLTGSVGLLSDALESLVNLAAAVMTLAMLTIAARPPDEEHAYGYSKAEYFSSGLEGTLIFVAAVIIGIAAIERLLAAQPLERVGFGLAASVAASMVNFAVARVLLRAGRRWHSIALEADAQHLMTDVWTSAGVITGVLLVALTDWLWLDPVIALAVAVHIIWIGVGILRRSVGGLLDHALPEHERRAIEAALDPFRAQGIEFHALRTRAAAGRSFVSMHVLVPGGWSVQRGHDLVEEIETRVRDTVANATVFTHLEPLEDPVSYGDERLDRKP
jgi:cation diffusion facilitator family transporter